MTNLDCLKALCERMFGYKSNGDNIADVLNDMARNCTNNTNKDSDYIQMKLIDTGKKWIDGKTVYRLAVKTSLGQLANEINKYKPHTIVSFYGQSVSMYGHQMPIPSCVGLDSQYKMDFLQDNTTFDVMFQYGSYFQDSYTAYCVIEFTQRDGA